jgi:hypothetical protein
VLFDDLVIAVHMTFIAEGGHGLGEDIGTGGLTGCCLAYDHDSKSHIECLEKLDCLFSQARHHLQVHRCADTIDLVFEFSVVRFFDLSVWEKVRNQGLKKWQILFQKLRYVGVPHGPNKYFLLTTSLLISSFQSSSHHQHTLNRSHTKIIMVLLRKLLRR